MPLKPKKLYVRNWERIGEAEVVFPSSGMVWVTGDVGAGKTALGECLSFAAFGVTGRYNSIGDYSTEGKGNCYVRLEAELEDKPLVIECGYKCRELSRSGEGLRLTYDNQPSIERDHVRATRAEITALTGVGDLLAQWTVFLDGDRLKFHKLAQAEAVELVMAALNQPPWAAYHERARKVTTKLRADLALARQDHEGARHRLEDMEEELAEAREDVKTEGKALREAREGAEARVKALRGEQKKLREEMTERQAEGRSIRQKIRTLESEQAEAYAALEVERLSLVSEAARLRALATPLSAKYGRLLSDRRTAENALTEAQEAPDICPECKQKLPDAISPAQIKKLQRASVAARALADAAHTDAQAATERAARVESRVTALETRRKAASVGTDVTALSRRFERLGPENDAALARVNRLEESIARAGQTDESRVQAAQAVVVERERLRDKGVARLGRAAETLAQAEVALKVSEYWQEAFGPTGIPNMVLRDTIAPLNTVSSSLSQALTAHAVNVSYATRRELASGEEKSQLIVKVDNRAGSHRVGGASKGESGLIGLTIAETLAEVGRVPRRVGYRWYDECMNTQDPALRQRILAHIKAQVRREGLLAFVVDHHRQGVEEACDHTLTVTKEGNGTVYRWD